MRVAWDIPDLQPNGPDIAVVLGVREQRNWSTFDVAQEGVRPALIVEVTSPETRALDLVDKLEIYALAGVPLYVIVDTRRWKGAETLHLLGYRLMPTGYEVLAPDERGWLWLDPVGLWLGVGEHAVQCYDAHGNPVESYKDLAAARAAAEARAIDAEARASDAEARLRALEQELQRLRGGG